MFNLMTAKPVLVFQLTASDLVVVTLMVVVFVLALVLPYPKRRARP